MKPIIVATALSMAIAASALAQTSGSSATTSPSSSTTPMNSPTAAGQNASPSDTNGKSMSQRSGNQTSATQAPSETEPSTGAPANGTENSLGRQGLEHEEVICLNSAGTRLDPRPTFRCMRWAVVGDERAARAGSNETRLPCLRTKTRIVSPD